MNLRLPLYAAEWDGGSSSGGAAGSGADAFATAAASAPGAASSAGPVSAGTAASSSGSTWTWAGQDGKFSEGWHDHLPDGLKNNPSLKTFGSLPDLAKAYVETKGLVGKRLEMPGEGASPEQIANWRKTVGAPERPEGYRGEARSLKPDMLPDDIWNVEAEGKFLELAHRHHLPPAAVKDILNFYGGSLVESLKSNQMDEAAMVQAETAKLQQQWGNEFNANLHAASRMAKTVGLDPQTDPIFTNARAVEAFAKMARLISGDKLISGQQPGMMASTRDRAQDITDPKSQSVVAREYRGEYGPDRQAAAQTQLHYLLASTDAK